MSLWRRTTSRGASVTVTLGVRIGDLCEVARAIIGPDEPEYEALPSVGLEQVASGTGIINLNPGSRTGDGRSVNFRFDERHVLYGNADLPEQGCPADVQRALLDGANPTATSTRS